MTTTDAVATDDHAHEIGPRDYVQAAFVLGLLTLAEFSTYLVDFGPLGIPLLIVLIVIKFVMVANIFMHLKFDNRIYTQMMYGGLILAATLYVLTLTIIMFASAPPVS